MTDGDSARLLYTAAMSMELQFAKGRIELPADRALVSEALCGNILRLAQSSLSVAMPAGARFDDVMRNFPEIGVCAFDYALSCAPRRAEAENVVDIDALAAHADRLETILPPQPRSGLGPLLSEFADIMERSAPDADAGPRGPETDRSLPGSFQLGRPGEDTGRSATPKPRS